jgi:hypothetical protein
MTYVGIRGHRGAGKSTVAYLLAKTINYLLTEEGDAMEFDSRFHTWCNIFRQDETVLNDLDLDRVIIEGFGDGPKMMANMLTGIPFEDMNNDYKKDHTIINLKDFKVIEDGSIPENAGCWDAKAYFMHTVASTDPEPLTDDVYMTLREFILYFGIYVMQNAFGRNVWVKSLIANNKYYNGLFQDDCNRYKIFPDIKASSEITYIKDKGGVIIKVSRPGHKKVGGMDLLRGDSRYDYEVVIDGELESLSSQILKIANEIIDRK